MRQMEKRARTDFFHHPSIYLSPKHALERRRVRSLLALPSFNDNKKGLLELEQKPFTLIQTTQAITALAERTDIPVSEHTQLLSQSLDILHKKISNSSGIELKKRLTKEETLA